MKYDSRNLNETIHHLSPSKNQHHWGATTERGVKSPPGHISGSTSLASDVGKKNGGASIEGRGRGGGCGPPRR
eukprot:CAMPEP_0194394424 /NCGR_PEP_ID=MMETSP0174-20130528/123845_1 /TAXON_ID=216777 /ORGANISM="Proboscia alata, Strain PI-D3" /LENGTH=72 /DNA_ID=CAMNT_0039190219 /DNA_START=2222 /DNA_END=2440 /DNA_ORIENTATION=+